MEASLADLNVVRRPMGVLCPRTRRPKDGPVGSNRAKLIDNRAGIAFIDNIQPGGFIYLLDTDVIRTGDKHVRSRSGRVSGPNEMRMRDEIPNNRAGMLFESTSPVPFLRPQAIIPLIIAFNQRMPIGCPFK